MMSKMEQKHIDLDEKRLELMNDIGHSGEVYRQYRDQNDQAIRIGIFGDDVERALNDSDTVFLSITDNTGNTIEVPLLVPIDILEWYNKELMKRTYGDDVKAFAYGHPPIVSENAYKQSLDIIKTELEGGSVVLTDIYSDDDSSPIVEIIKEAQAGSYSIDAFGGETESRVDVFIAPTVIEGGESNIRQAPNLYEVYVEAVKNNEIDVDPNNGPSMVQAIEGDDAEHIWQIYEKPFEGLGENDPTYAGFDKDSLQQLLKDPEVIKVVNRVESEITTLLMFLQSFEKAPWFNSDYFKRNYPDYFNTRNIFMFPSIVTDESKRGLNYATDTLNLAIKMMARRGSNILVTFECTEVSATYIPQIVEQAVNNSGVLIISELDKPKSIINYFAIKKN